MRYELSDGTSHKFWTVERDGTTLRVRYGRIGTEGQSLEKSFATTDLAKKEEARLVAEKVRKGYKASKPAYARSAKAPAKPPTKTKAKVTAAPLDEKALLRPLGRVSSESNFIALVAVDGASAGAYRYPFDEDEEDPLDFDETIDGPLPIGRAKGLIVSLGGSGVADIYRFGHALVLADIAHGDDDVDADAEKLRALAAHPTTKAKRIGAVEVPSGVLVLMGQHHPGPELDLAKVAKRGVVATKSGAAIAVTPGRYEIWRESFAKPVGGDWGEMAARVRVVPAKTKVVEGEPLVAASQLSGPKPKHTATTAVQRLVDAKAKKKPIWEHAKSMALAEDGMMFAGQDDGLAVAGWNADGTLAWQRFLTDAKPNLWTGVFVQCVGRDLLALAKGQDRLLALDPKTGALRRSAKIPNSERFLVAGDRIYLLHGCEVRVLSYPALKSIATLEEYRNSLEIAVSPDGRWLASSSDEDCHVYDARSRKHVHTIDGDVSAVAFTADNLLLLGSRTSRVRIVDPKTKKRVAAFDAASDRARKPAIQAFACTAEHIAISRVDGTLVLVDARTRKLEQRFEKHATQDYFGPPVAFSPDGTRVWVGACAKGSPRGLSGYAVKR